MELLRHHIEYDDTDRDDLIIFYAQGALEYCLTYCDQPSWQVADNIPHSVKSAIILVFADMFEHRLAQSEIQLYKNETVERLLFQHHNFRGEP